MPCSTSVSWYLLVSLYSCFAPTAVRLEAMDHDVERASSHTAGPDSSPRQSLSRSRSNNGYGVSDDTTHNSHNAPHTLQSPDKEKDYIEVRWDGGDADPLCPRSFTKARKWIITWLLSLGSFTVYVFSSMTAPLREPHLPLHLN